MFGIDDDGKKGKPAGSGQRPHGPAARKGADRPSAPAPRKTADIALTKIKSVLDLPKFTRIYTNAGGQYELTESRREKCVAIGTVNNTVWILVDPAFYQDQSVVVTNLRERMRRDGLQFEKTVIADTQLIESVYSTSDRLMVDAMATQVMTPEGKLFETFIRYGLENHATDIHFEVRDQSGVVRYRIHGDLELMRNETNGAFTMEQLRDCIGFAYNKLQSERTNSHSNFSPDQHQSCMIPYQINGRRMNMRYQSMFAWGGFDVVMRYLIASEGKIQTTKFQDLGYSDDQADMLDVAARTRKGMVMFVGITGSGKSTSLKTIVANIPEKEKLKIITVEDPVEDEIPGATQLSVQRSLKADSEKTPFSELRSVLMRADPDTIMQGEIRDQETGETAQVFLETGHQVMATLHANSVMGAFPRLISNQIGFSLDTITSREFWSLLVYQALVPVLCKHCRIPAEQVVPKMTEKIVYKFGIRTDDMYCKNDGGCDKCEHRGTTGQTVVAEMMQPTRKILQFIREGKDLDAERAWRETSDKQFDTPFMRGKTVFEHALYKAFLGIIDVRVVERFETIERYENIWEL